MHLVGTRCDEVTRIPGAVVQAVPRTGQETGKGLIRCFPHLPPPLPGKLPPDTSTLLLSPMPGLLKAVMVEAGDSCEPGQGLAIVEAMKMENVLRAEKTAEVAAVEAEAGASLAADQVILTFVEG